MMKFFGSDRRKDERVDVAWQAELLWEFPDKSGGLSVSVTNVSMQGALVISQTMMASNRHLFVSDEKPKLRLTLILPGDVQLSPKVVISRFQKKEDEGVYHIGVDFVDLTSEEYGYLRSFFKTIKDL